MCWWEVSIRWLENIQIKFYKESSTAVCSSVLLREECSNFLYLQIRFCLFFFFSAQNILTQGHELPVIQQTVTSDANFKSAFPQRSLHLFSGLHDSPVACNLKITFVWPNKKFANTAQYTAQHTAVTCAKWIMAPGKNEKTQVNEVALCFQGWLTLSCA